MTANFNWNTIPGLNDNNTNALDVQKPAPDHFDDFFNSQLKQQESHQNPNTSFKDANNIRHETNQSTETFSGIPSSLHHLMNNLNLDTKHYSHSDDNVAITNHSQKTAALDSQSLHKSNSDQKISGSIDSIIPLSLTSEELTQPELKTYLRWYQNIQERKGTSKAVTLGDVFTFLHNFKIPDHIQQKINESFSRTSTVINIGQFFAILRLLGHFLSGKPLKIALIKEPAPIPQPISILNKKRKEVEIEEVVDENPNEPKKKLDIDSFTEFILTGERPVTKKFKRNTGKNVKFSDVVHFSSPDDDKLHEPPSNHSVFAPGLPQLPIDLPSSVNQIFGKIKDASTIPRKVITHLPNPLTATPNQNFEKILANVGPVENEEEMLKDVHLDTFKNVTQKAIQINTDDGLQPLEANLTGSASKSMKEHFMHQFEQTFNYNSATNSFNPTSISALAADPVQQNEQPNSSSTIPQISTLSTLQNPIGAVNENSTDYFGFASQQVGNSQPNQQYSPQIQVLNSNLGNSSIPTSGAPADPRSISTSPPPVPPPPPRSRKASRAASISNVPPPTPLQNPSLPPKPSLNEKQRKQYLSANDEINKDVGDRSVSPASFGINQVTNNNVPGMVNMNNSSNRNPVTSNSQSMNYSGLNNFQADQLQQQAGYTNQPYGQFSNTSGINHSLDNNRYNNHVETSIRQQQPPQPPMRNIYTTYTPNSVNNQTQFNNQNQYSNQSQYSNQNQFNNQVQYNNQNQFSPSFNNQTQYGTQSPYSNPSSFLPQSGIQQVQQTGGNRWNSPTPQPSSNGQLNWSGWNV